MIKVYLCSVVEFDHNIRVGDRERKERKGEETIKYDWL